MTGPWGLGPVALALSLLGGALRVLRHSAPAVLDVNGRIEGDQVADAAPRAIETARAHGESADASRRLAEADLGDTRVVAPFAAIVRRTCHCREATCSRASCGVSRRHCSRG